MGVSPRTGDAHKGLCYKDLGAFLQFCPNAPFYATLYGRSPELLKKDIPFGDAPDFPSPELDRAFREIAWKAVTGNPLSGVTDKDGNGVGDGRE